MSDLVWGKPVLEGQDLSIFFINIPGSKKLINQIFKILNTHQAMYLEIPQKEKLHNEILSLDEKIGELRIVMRKSFFNLDEKLKVYYKARKIEQSDENIFNNDFYGLGDSKDKSK